MKPSEGSCSAGVTCSMSCTLSMAAGPRRAEHGAVQPPGSWELQEVSAQMCPRAWLLAASIVTASPSQCSSGDKDGKGFVSPSLVTGWAHRKTGYKASAAQCASCWERRRWCPQPSPALRLCSFARLHQNPFSGFSGVVPASRCTTRQTPNRPPMVLHRGVAGDALLPPRQLFFLQNFFEGEKNLVENFH